MISTLILGAALATANAPQTSAAPAVVKPAPAAAMSRADFLKAIDGRFVAMDSNKDGTLDKLEIEAAETRIQANERTVLTQRREAAFKKLDTNKDGQLSLAEFNAGAPLPPAAKPDGTKVLGRLDKNKDQKISLDEYRAGPVADFDKVDANKDGKLSPQERASARRTPQR